MLFSVKVTLSILLNYLVDMQFQLYQCSVYYFFFHQGNHMLFKLCHNYSLRIFSLQLHAPQFHLVNLQSIHLKFYYSQDISQNVRPIQVSDNYNEIYGCNVIEQHNFLIYYQLQKRHLNKSNKFPHYHHLQILYPELF